MSDKRFEVTDIKDRMMILDYVEHFRTSYNQKDLKFLRQVFSDDALIITGKVIKVRKSEMSPSGNRVIYTTQTKQQYLDNLSKAFKANSYIKVQFDDVVIVDSEDALLVAAKGKIQDVKKIAETIKARG